MSAAKKQYGSGHLPLMEELTSMGIKDQNVLNSFQDLDRRDFVPEHLSHKAYKNKPLPIGDEQTISQPYIIAYILQHLSLKNTDRVLEIGTGSGYQTALLANIVDHVYSIEVRSSLAVKSKEIIERLGFKNITTKVDNGYRGWEEYAPFDKIVLSAATHTMPSILIHQLKIGGIIIFPMGTDHQELIRLIKTTQGVQQTSLLPVTFVPMKEENPQHNLV